MKVDTFWTETKGPELRQGDLLSACLVPVIHPSLGESKTNESVAVLEYDLVILTQSCDLEVAGPAW